MSSSTWRKNDPLRQSWTHATDSSSAVQPDLQAVGQAVGPHDRIVELEAHERRDGSMRADRRIAPVRRPQPAPADRVLMAEGGEWPPPCPEHRSTDGSARWARTARSSRRNSKYSASSAPMTSRIAAIADVGSGSSAVPARSWRAGAVMRRRSASASRPIARKIRRAAYWRQGRAPPSGSGHAPHRGRDRLPRGGRLRLRGSPSSPRRAERRRDDGRAPSPSATLLGGRRSAPDELAGTWRRVVFGEEVAADPGRQRLQHHASRQHRVLERSRSSATRSDFYGSSLCDGERASTHGPSRTSACD